MANTKVLETGVDAVSAAASSQPTPPPRARRRHSGVILLVLLLATGGVWLYRHFVTSPAEASNVVFVSGRIEGDEAILAARLAGRIAEIRAREGDEVKAGDIVAVLEDDQIRAREEQALALVRAAEARAQAARQQIAILEEQLRQRRLETEQARKEAAGRVRQAEEQLAAAEAELAQQEAAYRLAAFDRDVYARLARSGAASERQAKQAETTAATQEALVQAARRRVEAARGALTSAQSALVNPDIRAAQTAGVQQQIAVQNTEIAVALAEAARARGQLAEAQAARQDLLVRAPFSGTVATRMAEPGEVAAPGTPLLSLIDLSKVYLRGFVPEGQIGRVRVGQPARVYLDSAPNRPIEAYVSRVDPQATFTPENTYFREDRVKQAVGVKLQLKQAVGFAKPGMPADGEILVEGSWPVKSRVK